jgi:outer membrane protein assembly factor BamD (BamD/ComL family)
MSNLARKGLLAVNQSLRHTAGRAIAVAGVLVAIHTGAFGFADHAALVRVANIYVSPDSSSAKLAEVERGRELVILETSREWVHVQALIGEEKMITGWMLDKGVVKPSTPDGDKVIYGAAVDSEDEASRRHGRRGADQDALRLYYRVYDIFPNSTYAGEALYRAADIRWQVERIDVMSRGSARERDPYFRQGMNEDWMREVMKKFPGTRWADLAAFHLIENKLCGDWQGSTKCPDKEADIYEKYANERPRSPAAAQALYLAATRRAAMVELYKTEENKKKSDDAKDRAIALTQRIVKDYSESDWSPRAQALLFLLQQGVPTYGNEIQ